MSQLKLADEVGAREATELQQQPAPQVPSFSPLIAKLAIEIGTDRMLAEAALAWVKAKKQEILISSLNTLYTPAQLEAMRAKAEAEAAAA